MPNIHYPISHYQVESFKTHACVFSKALRSIDETYVLKGCKRVDAFAKICGYDNHGQMVALSKGYTNKKTLRFFAPKYAPFIARALSEETGFKYDAVLAAINLAAKALYDDVK